MAEPSLKERLLDKEAVLDRLEEEWSTLAELLASLPAEAWGRPALPGWTVHDVVSHLVGGERMMAGAPLPDIPTGSNDGPHIRNDIARVNEAWVVALRDLSPSEMVDAFRAITGERLAKLRSMSEDDFEAPSWTPVGDATYGRYMEIRVFDFWMHEQDIRAAAGVPGHEAGPAAELSLQEVIRSLGYIVGKRAGFPDGTSVEIRLSGPMPRTLQVVVEGRARLVDELAGPPTASVELNSTLFCRLAGGRQDPVAALPQIELGGDQQLGRQLVTNLAYTI